MTKVSRSGGHFMLALDPKSVIYNNFSPAPTKSQPKQQPLSEIFPKSSPLSFPREIRTLDNAFS
jgi:hypothetical protein